MTGGVLGFVLMIAIPDPFGIFRVTDILEGDIAVHQDDLPLHVNIFIVVIIQFRRGGAVAHPNNLCGHLSAAGVHAGIEVFRG